MSNNPQQQAVPATNPQSGQQPAQFPQGYPFQYYPYGYPYPYYQQPVDAQKPAEPAKCECKCQKCQCQDVRIQMEKRVEEELATLKKQIFEQDKLAWEQYGRSKGFIQ